MSSDCISIRTTFTHLCRESWKNIVSKITVNNIHYAIEPQISFYHSEKMQFHNRAGLLTLASLSRLICPDARGVQFYSLNQMIRNRRWNWRWKLFWHPDVEIQPDKTYRRNMD